MRTETTTRTLYQFSELSEEAKDKAVESLYDLNVDYEWWDSTYEDAGNIGLKITSFDIDHHQIEGSFTESPEDVANNIMADHGKDCETYATAKAFVATLEALRAQYPDEDDFDACDAFVDAEKEFLHSLLEDYRIMLSKGYDYLTTREAIIETIESNEYEFTAAGALA